MRGCKDHRETPDKTCTRCKVLSISPPPSPPSLLQQGINFGKAIVDHALAGCPTVSPDIHAYRLSQCRSCEMIYGKGDKIGCVLCGCNLITKTSWAEQRCPHPQGSRWELPLVSVHDETRFPKVKPLKWSYGVTTVVSRREDGTLYRTLSSLREAGFTEPHIYIDGSNLDNEWYRFLSQFNASATARYPAVKTAGNWWLSLWDIYVRNPEADRYAMFQDDFITIKNLRTYLDGIEYPHRGYLNLYTFPENQARAPEGQTGFYLANQLGKGAVALVFDQNAIKALLCSDYFFDRFKTSGPRRHRSVDGGIVTALNKAGYKEFTHNPSLTQHTGDKSTMGNPPHLKAVSFPGESFDARNLLVKGV